MAQALLPVLKCGAQIGCTARNGCATQTLMLTLSEIVDRYRSLAQRSGEPVPLAAFGLSPEETSRLFTALDEDYHISRFLRFSCAAGERYAIAGESVTHISIDPAIASLL